MQSDRDYMQRCLDISMAGFPEVMPNPLVGCVITSGDAIIAEGWHRQFGGPHAEVNAFRNYPGNSFPTDSVLYVNLEPCSHHGKTPPCADLIINSGIKKVVIAAVDPNPLVSGNGIKMLQDAGIEVISGLLENEARELNKRFFVFHEKKRPYFILKWAQTADGFIAAKNRIPQWISHEYSQMLVHKWRTEEMAIMAGTTTILTDNPHLTARKWQGKNPVRILLDKELKLSPDLHVFEPNAEVLVFNQVKNEVNGHIHYIKTDFDQNLPAAISRSLFSYCLQSVIIEGGAKLLQSFIEAGLWDEARVFIADKTFGEGVNAPIINRQPDSEELVGPDRLLYYRNNQLSF